MNTVYSAQYGQDHERWSFEHADEISAALGPEGPGVLLLRDYYPSEVRTQLEADVVGAAEAFSQAPTINRVGLPPVRQNMRQRVFELDAPARLEQSVRLNLVDAKELVRSMASTFPSLRTWEPRTMRANQYHSRAAQEDPGIDPHRDPSTDVGLVVDDIISGGGTLGVLDAEGNILREWDTPPGTRVLLRASGLFEADFEIRPEHFAMPHLGQGRLVTYIADNSGERSPLADPKLYT